MSLTDEQRKRIEESRQKALALRASRQQNSVDKGSVGIPVANQTLHGQSSLLTSKSIHLRENVCREAISKKSSYSERIGSCNSQQSTYGKPSIGCITGGDRTCVPAGGIKSAGGGTKSGSNSGDDAVVVKCLLISRERFAIDMRYYPPVIDVFKHMTSRQYG
jgi:hypothetical protein